MHAYPLSWPFGWARSKSRRPAAFYTTSTRYEQHGKVVNRGFLSVADSCRRLLYELGCLKARDIVISTNLPLRQDGLPRSDQREPEDSGAAVYFTIGGQPRALACDRWTRVADNIAALAKHVEAMRGMDRWGVGSIEQAFAGYAALPAPGATKRHWRDVLRMPAVAHAKRHELLEVAESRYRTLARERHPDAGGNHEQMAELNAAIDAARREIAGSAAA